MLSGRLNYTLRGKIYSVFRDGTIKNVLFVDGKVNVVN